MNDDIPKSLRHAVEHDRMAHAYLFYGRQPSEYSDIIQRFFNGLNCPQTSDLDHCGQCEDCIQMKSGNHPDFNRIPSENRSGQQSLGVDTVRDRVIESASLSQARGQYKLFWLHDINQFTPEASNTLLKVLEEPSDDTVFVLTARSLWDTLDTIRSRCHWIRFPRSHSYPTELIEHCNQIWPDESYSTSQQENWMAVLTGNKRSSDIEWSRSGAKGFLSCLLLIVRHLTVEPDHESIRETPSFTDQISYRLVPDILERFNELEHGGQPDLIVNSLLEEIYFPEEQSEWVHAT